MGEPSGSYVHGPGEGFMWRWLGRGQVRILALGEEVGDLYTIETGDPLPAGGGPEPHVQAREDEAFYVIDGGPVAFRAGNREVEVGAGGFVTIGSGTAHVFKNRGAPARLVVLNAPAGFDRFQREVAAPWNGPDAAPVSDAAKAARVAELAPKYGITMHPEAALFEREPEVHAVPPGDAPARETAPGLAVRALAGPARTRGRYAMAHARLSPGAAPVELGHGAAATGLLVLSGAVRLALGTGPGRDLPAGGFAHVAPGDRARVGPAGGEGELLVWHAPGVALPLANGEPAA